MNSRKWQVGMVALVVLSLGLLSFAPFLWRTLRLHEKSTTIVLIVVSFLQAVWFAIAAILPESNNGELEYGVAGLAGLCGILAILTAVVSAAWIFRPYRKEEITNPWNGG